MSCGLIKTAGQQTATNPKMNKKQDRQRARVTHAKDFLTPEVPKRMQVVAEPVFCRKGPFSYFSG